MVTNGNDFEDRLDKSMEKIDQLEVDTPELRYFTDLVKNERAKIAKRQKLQFALFIVASILIISVILLILFANILVFSVLQGVLLILFISIAFGKVKSGEFR